MNVSVVVPTVNSLSSLKLCIKSLINQSIKCNIIVVANGTKDGSQDYLRIHYPEVEIIEKEKPLGFAGAVNIGIKYAMEHGSQYIALLNNDAIAEKNWLKYLLNTIESDENNGIATCKIKKLETNELDSTGDYYTSWLLPYPRGRDETDRGQYDTITENVLSASGGASIYRVEMLKQIGLFDEDFFAYYEDVDLSLRAHHFGWKVVYTSKAIAYHEIGGTSKKIKGFTTFQTMKNLPILYIKNVPFKILVKYIHGFILAYTMFFVRAILRGHGIYAIKGVVFALGLTPKKIVERRRILKNSVLSTKDFDSLLVHDLPPNADMLRKLRKLLGSKK